MSELFGKMGLNLICHQSAMLVGEAAMGLYTYCVLYTRFNELDGVVPKHVAERGWSSNIGRNRKQLKALCAPEVRFLSKMKNGDYFVEKYSEWNETKAQIEKRRSATKDRQQKHKDKESVSSNASNDALVTRYERVAPVSVSVSGSGLSFSSEEGAGETPPANDLASGVMQIAAPQPEPDLEPEAEVREPATSHERYAKAYAEGQIEAGAEAYPWEGMQSDHSALAVMCAFAKGLRGEELLAWFRDVSSEFRQSVDGTYNPGFRPTKCLEWLKGGRPKRQQNLKLVQQAPADGPLWKMGEVIGG